MSTQNKSKLKPGDFKASRDQFSKTRSERPTQAEIQSILDPAGKQSTPAKPRKSAKEAEA